MAQITLRSNERSNDLIILRANESNFTWKGFYHRHLFIVNTIKL